MAVMICHLAPSGIWSQSAGTPPSPSVGQASPSSVILKGHLCERSGRRRRRDPFSTEATSKTRVRRGGARDALGVHEVADEAGHRDAAVLELGLAQEADGRRVRLVEELLERELEGVEVADDGVLLVGEGLEAYAKINR